MAIKLNDNNYLIYVQDLMQTILTCLAEVKVLSDGDYKKSKEADLSKRQITGLTILKLVSLLMKTYQFWLFDLNFPSKGGPQKICGIIICEF